MSDTKVSDHQVLSGSIRITPNSAEQGMAERSTNKPDQPVNKSAPKKRAEAGSGARKPLDGTGLDHGMSQVSLVETALSPLDYHPTQPLRHQSEYIYYDTDHKKQTGLVTVKAPGGLSPTDELILYGLLAISFADNSPSTELIATPHFLCRQLGLPIGGDHYKRLRESLHRLSEVHYRNSAWWDRQRSQHRDIGFHFFSHDLPSHSDSKNQDHSREPWSILWDPLFFRLMHHSRGFIWFDFQTYRSFRNPAARRGFLLLQKIFHHREQTPRFDLRNFASQQLGYSSDLEIKSLRQKIKSLIENWQEQGVVDPSVDAETFFTKQGPGQWSLTLQRGPRFETPANRPWTRTKDPANHPAFEILQSLELTPREIENVFEQYADRLIFIVRSALLAKTHCRQGRTDASPKAYFFNHLLKSAEATEQDLTALTEERTRTHYERRKQEAIKEWITQPEASEQSHTLEAELENQKNQDVLSQAFTFPEFDQWINGETGNGAK